MMSSTKIAAAIVTMAFLTGCTMRTQAPTSTTAYDFSERDAYGQTFGASPTYAGQDTSWTTSAPARAVVGSRQSKSDATEAAPAKAKNADEGAEGAAGKFGAVPSSESSGELAPAAPARSAPKPVSTPVQRGQSPALPGVGTSSH
jgi:hypothetical protein